MAEQETPTSPAPKLQSWSFAPPKLSPERLAMRNAIFECLNGLGTVAAIGVCTFCDRQFKVHMTAIKWVADAQESLSVQFSDHKCNAEDASQAAVVKKLLGIEK